MADRSVTYEFKGKFDSLKSGLTAAGTSVKDFGGKLTALDRQGAQMRQSLDSLGRTAGRIGLTAAAGLGAAAKASMDFEGSFARMEGLVGVASDQLDEWKGQVRELGPEYGATATTAADALFFITSAGLGGKDAMDALEASLKASAVGLGEVSTIADLTTSAMNAYGSDVLSAVDATDVLTAAVREGKLEPDQLAGAMGRVLPVASAMGVGFDEVAAAMAAMSRTGTNASESVTQIRGILSSILSPSQQAHKGFEAVGLSAAQLQQSLRDEGLHATLVTIMDAFDGNAAATEAVFGNIRALSGVMDLMGSNAEATERIFEKLTDTTGDLDFALGVVAGTAGFKTRQAFGELHRALVDIGDGALPVVAAGMSGMAKGLSAIPGPAKTATAGILGITAVLGGGLWFTAKTITGIANTRIALEKMGVSAARSGGAMRGLAKAAGALIALQAAGTAMEFFEKKAAGSALGVEELTSNLLDLNSAASVAAFDGLADSLKQISDPSMIARLSSLADKGGTIGKGLEAGLSSLVGLTDDLARASVETRKAAQDIEALDAALSGLVSSGGADAAREAFEGLAAAQGLSTAEQEKLLSILPGYRDALAGAANEAKLAARATDQFADASEDSADANRDEAEAILTALDAMRAKRSEAIRAANAEINYQASIDDARKALKDNGKTLDITTEKGRANRTALINLADSWNGLSDKQKNAKGSSASAREEFVKVATQMGMNEKAAGKYADKLFEIPPKRETKIVAETGQAESDIDRVASKLAALRDRTIRVNIQRMQDTGGKVMAKAQGGYISGPGTATSDSIPAYLSNGEYVVRAAAVEKYGTHMFDRLNAMHFADGGAVGYAGGGKVKPFSLQADPAVAVKDLNKAIKQTTKSLEREKKVRDDITSKQQALASGVTSSLRTDIFGAPSSVWGGGADWKSRLADRTANAQQFSTLTGKLKASGLKGEALEALLAEGSTDLLAEFAAMDKASLSKYAADYMKYAQATSRAGVGAGAAVHGAAAADAARAVQASTAELKSQTKELKVLTKVAAKLAKDIGREINSAAAKGKRGQR